jgi:hypothetical protein
MRVKYVDYATYLLRGKIASGDLNSAKTREQWAHVRDVHLVPAFGDCSVEAIKRADIEEWKAAQGARVRRRDYSPNPVNGWLRVCMRRTFQDLRRAAQVPDFVVRAISGHATVDMQAQYSTVSGDEVRPGLANKVISWRGFGASRTRTPQKREKVVMQVVTRAVRSTPRQQVEVAIPK